CLAVYQALHTPVDKLDSVKFVEALITKMKDIETPTEDEILDEGEDPYVYVNRLEKVLGLMEQGNSVDNDRVEEELGVYVSAHWSVPTAIYAFIRATNSIPDIECDNPFMRSIHYAVSLGGDTDTIASMAGSISGAYYGMPYVPEDMKRHCEALADAVSQADQLFALTHPEVRVS
ncbi:ADP-ribose glycohydrolase ARH3, partial [Halocaridina rubra]